MRSDPRTAHICSLASSIVKVDFSTGQVATKMVNSIASPQKPHEYIVITGEVALTRMILQNFKKIKV